MKTSAINPGPTTPRAVLERIFSLARTGLVGSLVIGLLPLGCERQAPQTSPQPGAIKREADMLKKQNEGMTKPKR